MLQNYLLYFAHDRLCHSSKRIGHRRFYFIWYFMWLCIIQGFMASTKPMNKPINAYLIHPSLLPCPFMCNISFKSTFSRVPPCFDHSSILCLFFHLSMALWHLATTILPPPCHYYFAPTSLYCLCCFASYCTLLFVLNTLLQLLALCSSALFLCPHTL